MKLLRWISADVACLACLACLCLLIPPPATADVNVTAGAVDDVANGNCSLVEAFLSVVDGVAQDACGDTTGPVVLPAGAEFVLDTPAETLWGENGLPVVDAPLVLEGNGATIRRDPTAPRFRLLQVNGAVEVTLRDVTLTGGLASDLPATGGSGGGVLGFEGADLTLEGVRLLDNRAPGSAGALAIVGTARLVDCLVQGSEAGGIGRALWANGALTLERTEVSRNGFDGHAVYIVLGTLEVIESSVVFNDGGGIHVDRNASGAVRNSTVSRNGPEESSPSLDGAGILVWGEALLESVTVAGNRGVNGSGVYAVPGLGTVELLNSVLADNRDEDCGGPGVTSLGGNLVESADNCFFIVDGVNGDITDVDPLLGPLQDNGGPTRTQLPGAGSPLIDAAVGPGCIATDQRGVERPQGDGCDIGAVEVDTAEEPGGPGPTDIPTAGERGLLILCLLLGLLGFGVLGRHRGSLPAGMGVVLLLLTIACGGAPEATADADTPAGTSGEAREVSDDDSDSPNRFTLSGSRDMTVRNPWVSIMEAAGEGLYDDDHPGRILWIRERDKDLRDSIRVEIVLMPGQFGPGTYSLHETVWADYSQATAGVVLPKTEEESSVLPMAIYAEDVEGEITLAEAADGTLSGRFRFRAGLDSGQPDPHLDVEGTFSGVRWPAVEG